MTPPESPPSSRADVYAAGRLAGALVRHADHVSFSYEDEYLEDDDAPAIATTLPKQKEPIPSSNAGAVPPFFAGLLPEGRRLSALQRTIKASADDEFALLVAVGADTVGDVQVVLGDAPAPSVQNADLDVSDWSEVDFGDIYRNLTGDSSSFEPSGLAGVQVKASVRTIALPVINNAAAYILKLEPPEYRHLVANEHLFLQAASDSGIEAADAEIVVDGSGTPALLVVRFDRTLIGERVQPVAQEDACQVMNRYPADKYNVSTTDVINALARKTAAPTVAADELLRQFAFAYLTCNGDAHAKNFSIYRHNGEWRVTPAYDTPSTYPYNDTTMALDLVGKADERIGRSDFVALGTEVRVRERAVHSMCDELVESSELWLPRLDALPYDAHILRKLKKSILYRRNRLAAS